MVLSTCISIATKEHSIPANVRREDVGEGARSCGAFLVALIPRRVLGCDDNRALHKRVRRFWPVTPIPRKAGILKLDDYRIEDGALITGG